TALTAAVPGGRRGVVLLLGGLGAAAQPGLARQEGGLLGRGQVLGGGALGLAGRTGGGRVVGGGVRGRGGGRSSGSRCGGGGRRGGRLLGGADGRLHRSGLRLGGGFRPCTGGGLLGRAPGRRGGVRTLRRGAFPARPRGRGTGGRGRRGSIGVGRVLGGLLLSGPGGLPLRGGPRVRGTPGGGLPGRALGRFGGGVRALRRGRCLGRRGRRGGGGGGVGRGRLLGAGLRSPPDPGGGLLRGVLGRRGGRVRALFRGVLPARLRGRGTGGRGGRPAVAGLRLGGGPGGGLPGRPLRRCGGGARTPGRRVLLPRRRSRGAGVGGPLGGCAGRLRGGSLGRLGLRGGGGLVSGARRLRRRS